MRVEEFDFNLPEELIAQTPLEKRSASRLLELNRRTGEIQHRSFPDIIHLLKPGDTLVLNNTRVIPARLLGTKLETGAKVEILLLKQDKQDCWEALVKPAKRVKLGTVLEFGHGLLTATCIGEWEAGSRLLQFKYQGIFQELLNRLGQMPLPPYITAQLDNPERYQTVYAKARGSAAAPTAGLHFTTELLDELQAKGIDCVYLTLHVGLGTFRPVQVESIEDHSMHSEYYELDEQTAEVLNTAKDEGRRIIAVGTTSARTLETIARDNQGKFTACSGWTDIFIYPGYTFHALDGLITNFHLPKSTLIMLVSAFAGRERVLKAYQEAILMRYRFFSFGDAMIIL